MLTNYDNQNNLPEISFIAGSEQSFHFICYAENGIDLLNISEGSATWTLCPYGEFQTTALIKTGIIDMHNLLAPAYGFSVLLDSLNTETLSGKYIQQITVVDSLGNTFKPGQGTIIILPLIGVSTAYDYLQDENGNYILDEGNQSISTLIHFYMEVQNG
jgi:hypothetical protein